MVVVVIIVVVIPAVTIAMIIDTKVTNLYLPSLSTSLPVSFGINCLMTASGFARL
jgi:hypothetical protein